jgi:hypothetical protein
MILHSLRAGSPVVTDPGCRPSAARGTTLAPLFGGRNPDQAFLNDRGDETAVTPEDLAARQPTRPGCRWGLLEVQQPVVGTERFVEPHGVIQAACAQPLVDEVAAVDLGLRETPLTATRWLAGNAAVASLMLGMAPPCSFPCSSPAGTADAAPEGSCPTATSAPYPAEEGPTVPTKPGPSALGRRWSQAEDKGA